MFILHFKQCRAVSFPFWFITLGLWEIPHHGKIPTKYQDCLSFCFIKLGQWERFIWNLGLNYNSGSCMVGIARRPPLLPTGWVGLGSALGAWTGQGVPDRSFSRVSGLAISQPQPRTDIELKRQSCQWSIC